jgi:hypothetical protein
MIVLLSASRAFAWSTEDVVWLQEDMPLTMEWSGLPDGLGHDETAAALAAVSEQWRAASCGAFDVRFEEVSETPTAADDGRNVLVFGDPSLDVPGDRPADWSGDYGDQTTEIAGEIYTAIVEVDITMADVVYVADAAIDAGCTDTWSFQAVLTREVGMGAGLRWSCAGDECTEGPWLTEATMYYDREYERLPYCDASASTLEDDDRLGIRWLYGHGFDVECDATADNTLAAVCRVVYPEGATAEWDFGDGTTETTSSTTHVYEADGSYTVTACMAIDGCDVPSCDHVTVGAVAPGTYTPAAADEAATTGCSHAAAGPWLVGAGLLVTRRGRRRSPTSKR